MIRVFKHRHVFSCRRIVAELERLREEDVRQAEVKANNEKKVSMLRSSHHSDEDIIITSIHTCRS